MHRSPPTAISAAKLAFLAATFLSMGSRLAASENEKSRIDADGTVHVRELTMPPSDFWTPEFKAFNADRTARIALFPPAPARTASEKEWEEYFATVNRNVYVSLLASARKLYPVALEDTNMAGVHVGIITPKGGVASRNQKRVLINLHGGGFVYGRAGRGLASGQLDSIPVASIGQIKIVTVDYRQAPFHAYPAASEDVEAVYRELLKTYEPEAIGIYGCSAGGALTAQAVARFRARGLPRPGAVSIHCSGPSSLWGGRNSNPTGDSQIWQGPIPETKKVSSSITPPEWYMEGVALNDPQAFPVSSDAVLAQFPPTLFLTGTRSFELSAVAVNHARFLKLGVEAELYLMEGAAHGDHIFAVGTPEAHDAYAYVARWFDKHLAR